MTFANQAPDVNRPIGALTMVGEKHPLWFSYPRMLLLQVVAVGLWIASFLLFVASEHEFFGLRGWHLRLLVQGSGFEKVAAVLYLFVPLSYLAARWSYRLAAASAVLSSAGAVLALLNCWVQPVTASLSDALGPFGWLTSSLLATVLWTAAAVLDRIDKEFHRRASMPENPSDVQE